MNPRRARLAAGAAVVAFVLTLHWGNHALAATVYKTVDENGVVSFSDAPPKGDEPVETLEIDARAPVLTQTEQAQLDAMRETTDRMVADRQQREKHRAEMRQQQVDSQARATENVAPGAYNGTYPAYYPYPVYIPVGRPRPIHPIARPPLRPPAAQLPEGVISPGHDYPASLVRRGYSPEVRAAFEK